MIRGLGERNTEPLSLCQEHTRCCLSPYEAHEAGLPARRRPQVL